MIVERVDGLDRYPSYGQLAANGSQVRAGKANARTPDVCAGDPAGHWGLPARRLRPSVEAAHGRTFRPSEAATSLGRVAR
jgi:hypothetical protein